MNVRLYWLNRVPFLLVNAGSMIALTLFLLICDMAPSAVVLIVSVWLVVLGAGLGISYMLRKRQLEAMLDMAESLDARYLIAEVLPPATRAEDAIYQTLLRMAGKSMLEEIERVQRERKEYKEYVEQWVHEIKTPITAMKLLCENNRSSFRQALLLELERTDRYTEQALYYARSEHTEKDYMVREIHLEDVVHQAIADNKYLLLSHQVRVQVDIGDATVFSDDKWLRFILDQLIVNAVKYRGTSPELRFVSERCGEHLLLHLTDNGAGIAADDLPRLCEKGFTGHNGRRQQSATGIGLYLCKRLCDKLGIGLHIASPGEGQGTTVTLSFQMNDFIQQVQG